MQQQVEAGDDARQHVEKPMSVVVIQKDGLPGIASGGDVVQRSTGMHETRSDPISHFADLAFIGLIRRHGAVRQDESSDARGR